MSKILYLLDHNINTLGGSQKSTKTMIDKMIERGHDVALLMSSGNAKEKSVNANLNSKCKVFIINERGNKNIIKYAIKKYRTIKKVILEYNPDVIHAQNPSSGILIGLMSRLGSISKSKKVVYTDRAIWTTYSKKLKFMFKFASKGWDAFIATTTINLDDWAKHTKLNKTFCVPNVLDDDWFIYSSLEEKKLKKKYNVDKFVNISFSGRYVSYKKWDTVFEICKKLADVDNINFIFAIASSNEKNNELSGNLDDEYVESIKKIIPNKCLFFRNASQEQMKEFYYLSDCFVLTSSTESFGRTLIEAMTKNSTVYGTRVGGVPEVIGVTENLFEVDDVEKISGIIMELCKDNRRLLKEKEYFLKYANSSFTSNVMAEKMDKIYREII